MRPRNNVFSAAVAIFSVFVLGCGDEKGPSPSSSVPDSWASPPVAEWVLEPPTSVVAQMSEGEDENRGLVLYQHYCSVCHGPEGKGDGQYYSDSLGSKPVHLADSQAAALPQRHIAKVIREGSAAVGKSSLCPPWGRVLSDDQVRALADHVCELRNAGKAP